MRPDVHLAALRAAAKVAFSVVLLNGCSGRLATGGAPPAPDGDDRPADDHGVRASASPEPRSPHEEPCVEDAGLDATPDETTPTSCEATLAAVFGVPHERPFNERVPQSKEVVACCDAQLSSERWDVPWIWDCCFAYDPVADPDGQGLRSKPEHMMACTPWGPPVPPSMRARRARPASTSVAAAIAEAVA